MEIWPLSDTQGSLNSQQVKELSEIEKAEIATSLFLLSYYVSTLSDSRAAAVDFYYPLW